MCIRDSRGIDRHLIRTRIQHSTDIGKFANATAHSERYKHLTGHLIDNVYHGLALFVAGRDIQEGQFIGTFGIVAASNLHRITGIADIDELHAFDNATVVNIEAWNDAFGQ